MEVADIWTQVKNVVEYQIFTINQTPVTIVSFLILILIISLFLFAAKLLRTRLLAKILTRFHIEEGMQFTLTRITQYIVIFIGIIVAFQTIGIDLSGIAVILGFLSVGIGFGLQNVTSNFIAGLILLFERPIKVGDRVTVGDTEGDVLDIHIRSTTIQSLNNISIIVPNSDFISNSVINWSHGDKKIRIDLNVGVSYDSDLDTVIRAMKEVAFENKEILNSPDPEVHLKNFGDSSWDMQLRFWIDEPKRYYYVRSDVNCSIVRKFRENNIEIPYPQRDLHLRSAVKMDVGREG